MPEPENNPIIRKFVDYVQSLELNDITLVYNGDVIDSKSIANEIPTSLPQEKKASLWEEKAEPAFDLAKRYFDYITGHLKIPNDRVIICCGNHDVNYYSTDGENLECPVKDAEKIPYGSRRFYLINQFINKLVCAPKSESLHATRFRTVHVGEHSVHFLIVNSQWRNKEQRNLCIDCASIYKELREHHDELTNSREKFGGALNIFVAHCPWEEYCENALYSWGSHSAVWKKIDSYFGLKFFGDKHCSAQHGTDYIVGAPLDGGSVTYCLHQIDDNGQNTHRLLTYENGAWTAIRASENIRDILK